VDDWVKLAPATGETLNIVGKVQVLCRCLLSLL
jgi:hypothetical protein